MAAVFLLPALAACDPAAGDRLARDAARSVIGRTVATRFPGVPVQPAIDCLIDNASPNEILGLASDTVTGPTAATTETILAIARRPEAIRCFAASGAATLPIRPTRYPEDRSWFN